jgi:hypothetical protein
MAKNSIVLFSGRDASVEMRDEFHAEIRKT